MAAAASLRCSPAGVRWLYRLHVYLDVGVPRRTVASVMAVLHSSFPFTAITHSLLSAEQHGAMTRECWNDVRGQLNGLKVLDVLDQQWTVSGREAELQRRDSADPSNVDITGEAEPIPQPSTERGRKRGRERQRREEGEEVEPDRLHQQPLPASDPPQRPRKRRSLGSGHPAVAAAAAAVDSDEDVPIGHPPLPVFRLASAYERLPRTGWDRHHTVHSRRPSSYRYSSISAFSYPNFSPERSTVDLSLFLTSFDCYVPGLTFVFGVARLFRCALVSTHRLSLATAALSSAFLYKEVVHEVGHLFGLLHCRLPCVMTYSQTVGEAQQKDGFMCTACRWKVAWMESGTLIKVSEEGEEAEAERATEMTQVEARRLCDVHQR